MKKRLLSILCATSLLIGAFILPVSATSSSGVFSDELDNLETVSSTEGMWEVFPTHPDIGRSVVGRGSSETNNLYYTFPNHYITGISVTVAEYSGFFQPSQVPIAVKTAFSNDWITVRVTASEETDIETASVSAFKQVVLTAASLPDGITSVRIGLTNDVFWTLFLDRIDLTLTQTSDFVTFADEMEDLEKVTSTEGMWEVFSSHPDIGRSVAGRGSSVANNLYYTFSDHYILGITVTVAEYSGFFQASQVPIAVRTTLSDEWITVNATASPETDIGTANVSSFKQVVLTVPTLPERVTSVRIGLTNDVFWTLFLDRIELTLSESVASITGDFNSDGVVNILDLVRLKKAIADGSQDILYDINGDNAVNAADIMLMKRFLLGLSVLESPARLVEKRNAQTLSDFSDTQIAFLAEKQLTSGAFPVSAQTGGTVAVNPYFADYIAMALLARPTLYLENVEAYLDWHFAHLNADGTIYDYIVSGGVESTNQTYDSTDSYAATFLWLLSRYYEVSGNASYLTNHQADILKVANAMCATMYEGLTCASPSYPVRYTMDNCEVYQGLLGASAVMNAIGEKEAASAYATEAAALKSKIEQKLWNNAGYYEIGLTNSGAAAAPYNSSEYYPSGMAQMAPIITDVISDSNKATQIYAGIWQRFDVNDLTSSDDSYCFFAATAAKMGDTAYLIHYVENFEQANIYLPYIAIASMSAESCAAALR